MAETIFKKNSEKQSNSKDISMVKPSTADDGNNQRRKSNKTNNKGNKPVAHKGTIKAPEPRSGGGMATVKEAPDRIEPPEILVSTRHCKVALIMKIIGTQLLLLFFFFGFSFVFGVMGLFQAGAMLIFGLALLVVDILIVALQIYSWRNSEFQIRDNAVVNIRQRLFSKNEAYYSLKKDFDFTVRQGLLGKILNCGTLVMSGPLSLEEEVAITEIPYPRKHLKKLMTMINDLFEEE
jgi:hypothetical protein